MMKSKSRHSAQDRRGPDRLAKTGQKIGVELQEAQLGQVTGGAKSVKIDFGG